MKKIFSAMLAFAMIFATSCQNDLDSAAAAGDTSAVSFKVSTPEIATRAYSDGTTATVLKYAVYDEAGTYLDELGGETTINLSTKVDLQLVTGNSYTVIFWAAAADAPYTVDFATKTMTVDYAGAKSNAENRDAFYARHDFTVNGAQTEDVILYRPFAQLNIGANDYEAASKAGYEPKYSAVTVKSIYEKLNFFTGEVSNPTAVTFDYEAIPSTEEFPVEGYDYLAMNYLLVDNVKELIEVEFKYTETDDAASKSRTVGSVPVQRNYRTNIYGQLFTSDVDINVVIEPAYDGDFNYPSNDTEKLILLATLGGEITLTEDVNLTQPLIVTKNLKINLNGHNINGGTVFVDGVTTGTDISVMTVDNNANLTISGEGTIESPGYGLNVLNGVLTVNDATIVGALTSIQLKNGVLNLESGTYRVTDDEYNRYVINCINNDYYAGNAKVNVTGGTFCKFNPADSWSEGNFSVNFVADGYKSVKVGDNYQVVSNSTMSNAAELAAALTADVEEINVILFDDIDLPISTLGQQTGGSGEYKLGGEDTKKITIDLNGKKLNITTTYWSAIGAKNDNALFTIKNGTITSTGNSAGTWNAWDLRFSNCNYVIEDVVFEKAVALDNVGKSTSMKNVTITDTHNTDTYGLWITAEGQTVTLEDCVIDMLSASDGRGIKIDEQYVGTPAKVTLNVTNVTFKTEEKAAILVKSAAGADINASNLNIAEVAADNMFAVWVDSDAADHADKVVVTGALKAVEASAEAIANAPEGSTIVLAEGKNYGLIEVGELKNVTIKGAEGSVMIFKTDADTKIENVTLQKVNFEYTGATVDCGVVVNENAQIDNLVLDGCTFIGTGAKAGRGISGKNNNATIEIKNCTFKDLGYPLWYHGQGSYSLLKYENCTFENIKSWAIMPQGGFNGDLTVTGCTFKDCLGGGLIKAGTLTAGHTFTFTDNTITGCTVAGDHNWFQFNVSAGTAVISGNKKDGADWIPGVADGLK